MALPSMIKRPKTIIKSEKKPLLLILTQFSEGDMMESETTALFYCYDL